MNKWRRCGIVGKMKQRKHFEATNSCEIIRFQITRIRPSLEFVRVTNLYKTGNDLTRLNVVKGIYDVLVDECQGDLDGL